MDGILVGSNIIKPVSSVKNLGLILDQYMKMDKHIAKVCSTAYYHIRNINVIRHYLTREAACTIIHAFISSQLDYCNSLMYGIPDYLISRLQRVQNTAARVIFRIRKFERITPALIELHWLPVKLRIKFKIILIVFKALRGRAPAYISDFIKQSSNKKYRLRSSASTVLSVPRHAHNTFGGRSFAVCGPKLWNELPSSFHSIKDLNVFKQQLKTHLFNEFVNNWD